MQFDTSVSHPRPNQKQQTQPPPGSSHSTPRFEYHQLTSPLRTNTHLDLCRAFSNLQVSHLTYCDREPKRKLDGDWEFSWSSTTHWNQKVRAVFPLGAEWSLSLCCSSSSSCFFMMSFLGITLILAVKKLIWSTAAVFHNVAEALAQKCDGDQCSLYLLGWRLTLINVGRRCINLRTIRALFGGLYFKLCHLLCRCIVLLTVGPSLFLLCDVSGALLYIITYHKWAHGKWQGRHLQRGRRHFINVSSADFY